jgi:putative glycosyltransferase (TIGR04372 family)
MDFKEKKTSQSVLTNAMEINSWEARVRFLSAIAISGYFSNIVIGGETSDKLIIKADSLNLHQKLIMDIISYLISCIKKFGVLTPNTINKFINDLSLIPELLVEVIEYSNFSSIQKLGIFRKYTPYFLSCEYSFPRFLYVYNSCIQRTHYSKLSIHGLVNCDSLNIFNINMFCTFSPFIVRSIGHVYFLLEYIKLNQLMGLSPQFNFICTPQFLENGNGLNSLAQNLTHKYGGCVYSLGSPLSLDIYKSSFSSDVLLHNSALLAARYKINSSLTFRQSSKQYFSLAHHISSKLEIDSHINPIISSFCLSTDKLVLLHHRDSGFSGNNQPWRDTDLSAYHVAIQDIISLGYKIVIMNPVSLWKCPNYPEVLDLGTVNFTLSDQLFLINKASFFIATASGISHFWVSSGLPILMLNVVAIPASSIHQGILHVPKKISLRLNCGTLTYTEKLNVIKSLFKCTWDGPIHKYLTFHSYENSELARMVTEFFDISIQNRVVPSAYDLLDEIGLCKTDIPDVQIHPMCYDNLLESITTLLKS